jgi:hypothetical protein
MLAIQDPGIGVTEYDSQASDTPPISLLEISESE